MYKNNRHFHIETLHISHGQIITYNFLAADLDVPDKDDEKNTFKNTFNTWGCSYLQACG